MNKKHLTEQEIRTRYITPAIRDAGWPLNQIREELYLPFPLAEQKRIAAKVEALLALCDALAAEVAAAEEVRARLLQAVLNGG